jgi:uncharacterized phage protein (TIGR02218 family)
MKAAIKNFFNFNRQNINYQYSFEVLDKENGHIIKLRNKDLEIVKYLKTDSGFDEMQLKGHFSEKGIYPGFDINNLEVKVILESIGFFSNMKIKSSEISGSEFIWLLEPKTINLKNHQVNKFYSKTCRVSFCSKECGLLLKDNSHIFLAYQVRNHYITLDKVIKPDFIGGDIIFRGKRTFKAKILKINEKIITLDKIPPEEEFDSVELVAKCDKTFESCCKIFNNAVNFRGEPHIPENDKFMVE